ncbi:unnamed protein product [Caenorhabditis auriculariae]|uniref:SXP/RAL-2 family protein Ani s 5-like cation-binding domain-containing protein n=1 Tax=Caenorhabditis auriculariae TaxID=2777116 RepID=A0A8S1HV66_9PELO|nr:unnamed protein product [Caenorhabditis auriculariae]
MHQTALIFLIAPLFLAVAGIPRGAPPDFVAQLNNSAARAAYKKIVSEKTITVAEIDEQLDVWARKFGVEDQYKKYKAGVELSHSQMSANVTSVLEMVPKVNEMLNAVFLDKSKTPAERRAAVRTIKKQYPLASLRKLDFMQKKLARII